jgi:hypothetical protein
MADSPEDINDDLSDDDRWAIAELSCLIETIDRQQAALEQLAHEDPVAATWFGGDDEWVDSRLSRKPPK